jgi:hypothetical protein
MGLGQAEQLDTLSVSMFLYSYLNSTIQLTGTRLASLKISLTIVANYISKTAFGLGTISLALAIYSNFWCIDVTSSPGDKEQYHLAQVSVSFFVFKLNQMLFGLVSNLKNQRHLFLV